MPITPTVTTPPPLTYTVNDIVTGAFIETGAVAPGEPLEAELGQWGLTKFNEVLDVWSAMRNKVFSFQFQLFTLVPGLSPHTIGPSAMATLAVPQRPVRLESAALILNAGSPVDIPINIRDKQWWADQQTKSTTTNVPSDVYYDPSWPDGSLYFWPVPNANNQVRLQFWQNIQQVTSVTDEIGGPSGPGTLPPAYRTALKLTLAESLFPGLNRTASPLLLAAAVVARTAMIGNNDGAPRISTQDAGMPKSGGKRGDFNWSTGGRPGGAPQ